MIVDLYVVYKFLRKLTTPFNKWRAYKTGVIDENGNIIKKKKDRLTLDEKDSFTILDNMVLKIKKLVAKVPSGKSQFATYASALYLLKEGVDDNINEELLNELIEEIAANNTSCIAGTDEGVSKAGQTVLKRKEKFKKRDFGDDGIYK